MSPRSKLKSVLTIDERIELERDAMKRFALRQLAAQIRATHRFVEGARLRLAAGLGDDAPPPALTDPWLDPSTSQLPPALSDVEGRDEDGDHQVGLADEGARMLNAAARQSPADQRAEREYLERNSQGV